ncbi:MAG: hypothetical protein WDN02_07495 [Methylovirgula sp.]|uniref:ABC transporter permease n=1 Tax=Methylovirgula sp. TaxID=1978224 RepID=UPI00307658DF
MAYTDEQIAPNVVNAARPAAAQTRIDFPNIGGVVWRVVQAFIVPGIILAIWAENSHYGWISPRILPPPSAIVNTFEAMIANGDIGSNLGISLLRVLEGFLFGATLGLALGIAMGLSDAVEAWIGPLFRFVTQIPTLVWIPLLMQLLGIDEALEACCDGESLFDPDHHDDFRRHSEYSAKIPGSWSGLGVAAASSIAENHSSGSIAVDLHRAAARHRSRLDIACHR